jgi:Flavin containing amine oxidoreductase
VLEGRGADRAADRDRRRRARRYCLRVPAAPARSRRDDLHFAGEHTATGNQGFLEGAVETGERAADEVLAAVGGW